MVIEQIDLEGNTLKNSLLITMAICSSLTFMSSTAFAEEPHVAPIRDYIELDASTWLGDPVIIEAIKQQNLKTADLTEEEILALDKKWRAQADADAKPMIDEIMKNSLSAFLKEKQAGSAGLISEAFVMDARGLNVGQSNQTSDYWQGDEAKWQKTYLAGPDSVFIDEAEIDDSTQALQSQASVSIKDPDTGKVIGAITIGINLDSL